MLGPDAVAFNGSGRPGYDIPLPLYDEVGSGSVDSDTNVTDPDFEIPSEWKYALGMTFISDDDYVFTADVLLARKNDSAVIRNLADGQVAGLLRERHGTPLRAGAPAQAVVQHRAVVGPRVSDHEAVQVDLFVLTRVGDRGLQDLQVEVRGALG